MELLYSLGFVFAIWLTFLTRKMRDQKRINDDLIRKNKIYQRELLKLGYEQDAKETDETKEA